MTKQAEASKLLEEFPTFKKYCNRLKLIEKLKVDALHEQEPEFIRDSYMTVLNLSDKLYFDLITYLSEEHIELLNGMDRNCREWKDIAEKLEGLLKEERQQNREMFDNLCAAFLINPREAFETILKFIERDEKTKCPDGKENLSWTLTFNFWVRLKMAWKLVTG